MHHFVTEMCTCVHISVTKWCIMGHFLMHCGFFWDGTIRHCSTVVYWCTRNFVRWFDCRYGESKLDIFHITRHRLHNSYMSLSKTICLYYKWHVTLQRRYNGRDGVPNHQPHDCLLNRLFGCRSKKTPKLRVTGLCAGIHRWPVNSPHKGPVTRKLFPFDGVIMSTSNETSVSAMSCQYHQWYRNTNNDISISTLACQCQQRYSLSNYRYCQLWPTKVNIVVFLQNNVFFVPTIIGHV